MRLLTNLMRIIGYTYEADAHCVECAKKRFRPAGFLASQKKVDGLEHYDEHLILLNQEDVEGNRIHPIFSNDQEFLGSHCGTCFKEIGA